MRPQRTAQMRPLSGERLLPGGTSRHYGKVSGESTKEAKSGGRANRSGYSDGSCTAIRKRPPKGLLAGLYELPNTEGYLNREEALEYVKELGAEPLYIEELPDARHIFFSHIEWRMKAYRIRVSSLEQTHAPGILFCR